MLIDVTLTVRVPEHTPTWSPLIAVVGTVGDKLDALPWPVERIAGQVVTP